MKHVIYLPPRLYIELLHWADQTGRKHWFETPGSGGDRTYLLAQEIVDWCEVNLSADRRMVRVHGDHPCFSNIVLEFDGLDDALSFETEWVTSGREPVHPPNGVDIEAEIMAAIAQPIDPEIDRVLLRDLKGERIRCQAGRDGECNWKNCPQLRDNEPHATGRHCPRDIYYEDEDY